MVFTIRPDGTRRNSICKSPIRNATICAKELRTINVDAPCGSELDFFYYSPWRAPGSAPVIDSCGTAGGVYPGSKAASAGGDYQTTIHAHRGMLGALSNSNELSVSCLLVCEDGRECVLV